MQDNQSAETNPNLDPAGPADETSKGHGQRDDVGRETEAHDVVGRSDSIGDETVATEGSGPAGSGASDSDPSQTQPMQSARLERLDHFTIEARIGEGGMGIVYRAYDPDLHRSVAIKKIHPRYERDEEYASRFLTEARAVAAAVHPNIAQIFSIHARDENAPPYFVMEFVDGESIDARVSHDGPLPLEVAVDCAMQAARGLHAAFQKGIVHRDIKPSNILLTRRNEVKLVDFGLARRTEDISSLTQAGVILGTPHFVSPEQSQGHHVDHRSDMYSLGCTLYYMLTGNEPFDGTTKVEVIVAHANEPAPQLPVEFPQRLNQLLQRLLAKSPDDRFQSYSDLLAEFAAIRRELQGKPAEPVRRRSGGWVVAMLLILGTLVGVQMLIDRWDRQPSYSPRSLYGHFYHADGDSEFLEYDFARSDMQRDFDRVFRYSAVETEQASPQLRYPGIQGSSLSWQNFSRPVRFPYLDHFEYVEVSGLKFRGGPDFELVIGYDATQPESQLRIFFGTDGTANNHVIECWHQGERLSVTRAQKHLDFTLQDRTSYNLKLTRGDEDTFDFVIEQNADNGTSERGRIQFQLPHEAMLKGAITLRSAGLRPQGWGVSLAAVAIGGRLDHGRNYSDPYQ